MWEYYIWWIILWLHTHCKQWIIICRCDNHQYQWNNMRYTGCSISTTNTTNPTQIQHESNRNPTHTYYPMHTRSNIGSNIHCDVNSNINYNSIFNNNSSTVPFCSWSSGILPIMVETPKVCIFIIKHRHSIQQQIRH